MDLSEHKNESLGVEKGKTKGPSGGTREASTLLREGQGTLGTWTWIWPM